MPDTCGFTAADIGTPPMEQLPARVQAIGTETLCRQAGVGAPTLPDILAELQRPGRDMRDSLPRPQLRSDVLSMEDLKPGMLLTGTVRNVIDFGAFVDIGVHQDGLVHVSELADRFVKDPRDVVKVGQIVRVRVLDVDAARKRISLSMKSKSEKGAGEAGKNTAPRRAERAQKTQTKTMQGNGAMAAAFAALKLRQ